ncbi:ABC-2 type transport system permease protein [Actinoplanes campanulatus]|uniref:ABC-2 type transport system permease protein n=1 Tax=Actinoplanes campanulatus TaxID=113559 RepID=A0A7W5AJC1_9ACTN|nr:ABC transporter permease subunit [Actinoplanes campanulatus]MBB3096979.1 ABC-2 type transport system permease protein [Actinoplanes campanulatus]GGN14851.1 ABC transporter permease [Actinoplanes campanulatus]GID37838.1 ABC transporter permease [Actinoplanes campanulatus]
MSSLEAATGYRPSRTLPIWAEVRRQASRRRTQLALGFMVLLPLIILAAFEFGGGGGPDEDGDGGGAFSSMADLATSGGLNFALFGLAVSAGFLLVVVVALFFGDTVASEASWGSLRYLLAVPVPRARLLGVKLTVAAAYSLVALLLLTGTGLLIGTLRYGWSPLGSTIAAEIPPAEGVLRLLGILAYLATTLLVVAGLAFLLSVLTDAALGAVGGAVLLWILSSILDQIEALGSIRNALPTHYTDAWMGLLSTPVQTEDLAKGAISAVVYATLFWGIAFYRFTRKDITS